MTYLIALFLHHCALGSLSARRLILANLTAALNVVSTPLFAQVGVDLRRGLGEALLLLMLFGFVAGVVVIISAALRIKHEGGGAGKDGLFAGITIAAAPAIMYGLYRIFGLDGATVSF